MRCIHCGSEWNSTTSVVNCPFCGKALLESTKSPKTLTSVLVEIRDTYGVESLGRGSALIGSVKDLAGELKREQTMLMYLEKCGGIQELFLTRDKTLAEQESAVAKVVRRMADELLISEKPAQSVCRTYMLVVSSRENEAGKDAAPKSAVPKPEHPKEPDAEAMYQLGNKYKLGQGTAPNSSEAVKWYRKAASQGHAGAQLEVGVMLYNADGVPRDYREAAIWFRKAAEQGIAEAQHFLDWYHKKGYDTFENGTGQPNRTV